MNFENILEQIQNTTPEQRLALYKLLRPDAQQPEHEENQNKKNELREWLCDMSNFFREEKDIFDEIENPSKPMKLIVGKVQSGKTNVICGIAVYNVLACKRTTVIIVRNLTGDYKQLALKFSMGPFGKWNIPVIFAGDKQQTLEINAAFQNSRPAVIIALANNSEVSALNRVLRHIEGHERGYAFDIVVDECDEVAYKTDTTLSFIQEFYTLKDSCEAVYGITATAFDTIFIEDALENTQLYTLSAPSDYKGVEHIECVALDDECTYKLDKYGKLPEDLRDFYLDVEQENMGVYEREGNMYEHPKIVLHRTSAMVKDHKKLMKAFATDPEFNESWTSIMYNGEGVWFRSPDMEKIVIEDGASEMIIEGVKGKLVRGREFGGLGIWSFKKISIGSVLQFIRDWNPVVENLQNIVIFSGRLASRGINFVSNRDYHLHLTHQLLVTSNTSTTSDLIQSIRLCGRYRDNIPLKLYAYQREINNLRKAVALQDQLIDGCMNMGDEGVVKDLYKKVQVFTDLVPKRTLSKKTKYNLNMVVRNGGYDTRQSDKEWGIKNLLKNVKKALAEGRDTIVIKIIKYLWDEETRTFRSASRDNLITDCCITSFHNYTAWNKQGALYQLLDTVDGNQYSINPDIKVALSRLLQ